MCIYAHVSIHLDRLYGSKPQRQAACRPKYLYDAIYGGLLHLLWLWTGVVISKAVAVGCRGLPDITSTLPVS